MPEVSVSSRFRGHLTLRDPRSGTGFRAVLRRVMFMKTTSTNAARSIRPIRSTVLLAGPLLTWSLLTMTIRDARPGELEIAAIVVALVWSPLFFSIPALMMQRERDRAVPAGGGPAASLRRGLALPGALLRGPSGAEFALSLAGWALLLAVNGVYVVRGAGILLG